MISTVILNELNMRAPYVIESFGGIETFLSYVKEYHEIPEQLEKTELPRGDYQKIVNYFYTLLQFNENIHIISPWALYIDFKDVNNIGQLQTSSIDENEPYQIYDLDNNLLYTVQEHGGIFGESNLDRLLISNSQTGSMYYVKYKTLEGLEVVELLLTNLYTREVLVPNELYKSVDNLDFNVVSIANYTQNNIEIYTYQTYPTKGMSREEIIERGDKNTLSSNSSLDLTPEAGMYVLLDRVERPFVNRAIVSNPNNDLLIPINLTGHTLYYLAVNTTPESVNKLFGTTLSNTNTPIKDILEINLNTNISL